MVGLLVGLLVGVYVGDGGPGGGLGGPLQHSISLGVAVNPIKHVANAMNFIIRLAVLLLF